MALWHLALLAETLYFRISDNVMAIVSAKMESSWV